MNEIYAEFAELAEDLLDEFGTNAVLLKPGVNTGPPHRPQIGPPLRHTIRVFRTSRTILSQSDPSVSIVKNSLIVSTIGQVQINNNDRIETPQGVLDVVQVREIAPVFLTMLWIVEVEA